MHESNENISNSRDLLDVYIKAIRGKTPGLSYVDKFGQNPQINTATAPEDIWNGSAEFTGFPTGAAETMEVLSSDVNDTAAGSGARTIKISNLLDGDGREMPDITVSLNGTTPVSLGAQTYYRGGARSKVLTSGATGANEGIITLRHTTTTSNVFIQMPIGLNQTTIAAYTVPLGKTLYIDSIGINLSRASGAAGSAVMTVRRRPFGEVFQSIASPTITSSLPFLSKIVHELTERTDIKIRCESVSDNNTIISGTFSGLLIG